VAGRGDGAAAVVDGEPVVTPAEAGLVAVLPVAAAVAGAGAAALAAVGALGRARVGAGGASGTSVGAVAVADGVAT